MQSILNKLKTIGEHHPESRALQNSLSHLQTLQETPNSHEITWQTLYADIQALVAEGLWTSTPEDEELLQQLRHGPSSSVGEPDHLRPHTYLDKYAVIVPPPISAPLLVSPSSATTFVPAELVATLNHVYFLHLLATDPSKVLPPGKSLVSVLSRTHTEHDDTSASSLHHRVEDMVHKAFWDEALDTLSNPAPSIQLPRVKRLYGDLYDALKPLLPAQHPLLVTLSSPLSPTSSPLQSAATHLREVLAVMRERCAPARDATIDGLLSSLNDPAAASSNAELARLVVNTVQSIIALAETMKDDLSQFVIGTIGETQLKAVVTLQAKTNERRLVLELWHPERVRNSWAEWLLELASTTSDHPAGARPWVLRLVQALGLTSPLNCPLPAKPLGSPPQVAESSSLAQALNILPAPFFFLAPTLLYLQNYLQALVIAASLRSLVRLPAHAHGPPPDFMSRIWTLLKMEVDTQADETDTKLTNLADEVVRVRAAYDTVSPEEEALLRAAVNRTLQSNDPVFALLQRRLLQAIAARLAVPVYSQEVISGPAHMQTGRVLGPKKTKMSLGLNTVEGWRPVTSGQYQEPSLVVKGFEDSTLAEALRDGIMRLRDCIGWTESVWTDLIETGNLTTPN